MSSSPPERALRAPVCGSAARAQWRRPVPGPARPGFGTKVAGRTRLCTAGAESKGVIGKAVYALRESRGWIVAGGPRRPRLSGSSSRTSSSASRQGRRSAKAATIGSMASDVACTRAIRLGMICVTCRRLKTRWLSAITTARHLRASAHSNHV